MITIGEINSAAYIKQVYRGWHALGLALLKSGELKEAIGAALMTTNLRPNDQLAWTSLSQMCMKRANYRSRSSKIERHNYTYWRQVEIEEDICSYPS